MSEMGFYYSKGLFVTNLVRNTEIVAMLSIDSYMHTKILKQYNNKLSNENIIKTDSKFDLPFLF